MPESLSTDLKEFIGKNRDTNTSTLILKYKGKMPDDELNFAVTQIECRQKAIKKLPSFIAKTTFLFPTIVSAEQASHEGVARYHSTLLEGSKLHLDMTSGLGIDAMLAADKVGKVFALEMDNLKADYLRYNCSLLNHNNMEVVCADSVNWLKNSKLNFDTIYIDPARRDENNGRTYNFHDCVPDILSIQDFLRSRCKTLFIKASPLLDISQTLKEINYVSEIRAICVNGECKEILIVVKSDESDSTLNQDKPSVIMEAVDLDAEGRITTLLSFTSVSSSKKIVYATEEDISNEAYLYEPNAGIMKFAPWGAIQSKFIELKKIDVSSHLFVSKKYYKDFPGRVLKIDKILEKKDRKALKGLPVNVAVRNYPLTAVELRKQLGVKEGKESFIYGTRLKQPILILANRIRI